jgi:mono/diheme cytochrome c family protein
MGGKVTFSHLARAASVAALAAAAVAVTGCTNAGSASSSDPIAGKQQFVKKCGSCHTLARAGTKGSVGPNLDDAFRVARQQGWGDNSIRGVVLGQIGFPGKPGVMPANIVTGQDAQDVADYVSAVAAKPGQDAGLLATAVKAAGTGAPAVEKGGVLSIAADPGGQLSYVSKTATATAGPIQIEMPNTSGIDHNLAIEGTSIKTPIIKSGVAKATGTLKPGTYTYFCEVPGHRLAGMQGTLTVK